ncbi:MAG: anthrone oxygenase family protein [Alphaproteobacteria bacterium]
MGDMLIVTLTLLAALGSGLVGGVFFGFSTFVMKALARLEPGHGLLAMQSINRAVLNPWFLGAFLGTGALALAATTAWLYRWPTNGAAAAVVGCGCYVVGTVMVTTRGNVPKNMAIASLSPEDPDSARLWADYVRRWTALNHVRAASALVASAAYMLALVHWPPLS